VLSQSVLLRRLQSTGAGTWTSSLITIVRTKKTLLNRRCSAIKYSSYSRLLLLRDLTFDFPRTTFLQYSVRIPDPNSPRLELDIAFPLLFAILRLYLRWNIPQLESKRITNNPAESELPQSPISCLISGACLLSARGGRKTWWLRGYTSDGRHQKV
jgi:hypothetical protein